MDALVRSENHEHRHSPIRFVTPAQRQTNLDQDTLDRRAALYEGARHAIRFDGSAARATGSMQMQFI